MLNLRVLSVAVFIGVLAQVSTITGQEPKPKHIVMLIAEREYRTDESLKRFAEQYLQEYRVTILTADPKDRNSISGTENIDSADLLIVSVRRRTLPEDQLDRVRRFVGDGKPVIGIRTASHAFSLRGKDPPQGRAVWPEFDAEVFGGNYTNHHGNQLRTTVEPTGEDLATKHPIMKGLESRLPANSGGSLYQVLPLAESTRVLMLGRVDGARPEPVAWTFRRKDGGKSFYTSLGHVDDFAGPILPLVLRNAIDWSLAP